jgi:hypothetical protein
MQLFYFVSTVQNAKHILENFVVLVFGVRLLNLRALKPIVKILALLIGIFYAPKICQYLQKCEAALFFSRCQQF